MNSLDITDPVMPYRNSKMTSAVHFQPLFSVTMKYKVTPFS